MTKMLSFFMRKFSRKTKKVEISKQRLAKRWNKLNKLSSDKLEGMYRAESKKLSKWVFTSFSSSAKRKKWSCFREFETAFYAARDAICLLMEANEKKYFPAFCLGIEKLAFFNGLWSLPLPNLPDGDVFESGHLMYDIVDIMQRRAKDLRISGYYVFGKEMVPKPWINGPSLNPYR